MGLLGFERFDDISLAFWRMWPICLSDRQSAYCQQNCTICVNKLLKLPQAVHNVSFNNIQLTNFSQLLRRYAYGCRRLSTVLHVVWELKCKIRANFEATLAMRYVKPYSVWELHPRASCQPCLSKCDILDPPLGSLFRYPQKFAGVGCQMRVGWSKTS